MKNYKPAELLNPGFSLSAENTADDTSGDTSDQAEVTEIIELASEQIESLASAFELIASMLGDAGDESSNSLAKAEQESCTVH